MKLAASLVLFAALCSAQGQRNVDEKKNPLSGKKEAIAAGAKRFRSGCAACHGANAEGGRGPRLVENRDLYRLGDEGLFNIVRRGIPGTGMPPSPMSDEQTWQVVSFVRSLSSPASQSLVDGDAARGKQLYYGAGGCTACHAIRGQGGNIAPDLTDIGSTLTVAQLRESIEKPSARIAPGFEAVTVHLNSGNTVRGVAKSDSFYSLRVLDTQGQLHLINKSEASSIEWSKQSLMPENIAQQLAPGGVEDVIAFLAQQVVRTGTHTNQRRGQDIQ